MELVQIAGKQLLTSSLTIADGMDVDHRAIMTLVDKYKDRLEKRGEVKEDFLSIAGKKSGRPTRFVWLNERQFTFLATLMNNSDTVLNFKDLLCEEFNRQKEIIAYFIANQSNQEWLEKRQYGKVIRREGTDTIQKFVEYAKLQGSTKPDMYYMALSKAENKALFIIENKYPNVRNVLDTMQLMILASADIAVAKALDYGMEKELPYKEIYQLAKERLEQFAEIVGKSFVPNVKSLNKQSNEIN